MSWDKNTVDLSSLDSVVQTLDNLGKEYHLSIEAEVVGRGLNDFENTPPYKLRRLRYDKWVILEQITQDADCDVDDTISSRTFLLEEEPKDWQYIERTDILGEETDEQRTSES